MSNIKKAQALLTKLYTLGVRDFVVCPGGRNAPFVEIIGKVLNKDVQTHWGFEERSASFLALGLTMKSQKPVVVITTSGTAFVETSSALLEAHYMGLPLIVLSADRPEALWATGSPQTMIQKDFLKSHLGPSVDESFDLEQLTLPLHINCIFEEPLIDEPVHTWNLNEHLRTEVYENSRSNLNSYKYKFKNYSSEDLKIYFQEHKDSYKVLILVSGLSQLAKNELLSCFNELKADIYFESTGELSEHKSTINSRQIDHATVAKSYDLVVRVGGIPTHRVWRDFELLKFKNVIHFSDLPFPGLSFGVVYPLQDFKNFALDLQKMSIQQNLNLDQNKSLSLEQEFFSNLKEVVYQNSKTTDEQPIFYIGNSLPIRHWDLDKKIKFNQVYASRGLNGIDGQLSTAIGIGLKSYPQKVIAVLGDLTTMYDLSAPWYWLKNKSQINLTLIIVNNSGGQIFSKMFQSPYFVNAHEINFKHWADMWSLTYQKIHSSEELLNLKSWPEIIEFSSKGLPHND